MDKLNMSLDEIVERSKHGLIPLIEWPSSRAASPSPPRVARGEIPPLMPQYDRAVQTEGINGLFGGAVSQRRGASLPSFSGGSAQIYLSNLQYHVSEDDIIDLFSNIGPVRSATVHYDRMGRSLGIADVMFNLRADAFESIKKYNGVTLVGQPMMIKLMDEDEDEVDGGGRRGSGRGRGQMRGSEQMQPHRRRQGRISRKRKGLGPRGKRSKRAKLFWTRKWVVGGSKRV